MIIENTHVSRETLDERLARCPDYLKPILMAVRDLNVAWSIVPQGWIVFDLPSDGRTFIAQIGDDMDEAFGPAGFDRFSLERLVRRVRAAVVISSAATRLPYATAAGHAFMGRSVVLIETRPKFEQVWLDFLNRYRPGLPTLVSAPRPEGAVQ